MHRGSYQLPSSVWCRASAVTHPLGPIIAVYGSDLAASDTYRSIFFISLLKDGSALDARGLCAHETWTLADLREATLEEAEAQDYGCLDVETH